jgi:PAS domain S-box-containing protein
VSWKLYRTDGTPMPHDECPMAVSLKEGRIVRGVEAIAERPDGTRVWFTPYPTPLRDADGRIVGGINMLVDITERKSADDMKAKLAAIVESSDDAIVSKNLKGIIMSWNRGAERIFGYTAQEAIGRPVTMLMPPDRTHEELGILTRIRRGEKIDHYETIRRRKDGTLLNVSLTISPIADANGRIIGASKIARDITERKRTEEALRDAQLRLQQWNAELEQAVNIKTVELLHSQERFRALTTELNLTEQRERKRLATELHDHLQQMLVLGKLKLGQGKRLTEAAPAAARLMRETDEVLSDALQYTRTLVAELSPPVLRDHGLPAGLKWLGEYMQKHQLAVTVTVPEKDEFILPEDQTVLLFQSVRELLINSSKYAGTGQATVAMEHRDGFLSIEVRDEGAGFDLAAAAAGETSGGGISSKFGLFSIRERMRGLGGSLEIESSPGNGTTATLLLPFERSGECGVVRSEQGGRERHSLLSTAASPRIRVLLVDDHIMVRQGLKAVLDAYADVELTGEAGTGEEALRLVNQQRPEVVVMDINIPKMDGIEATKQIKSRYPETIVVGLSVNATKENEEAMKRAGAVRLMTKEAAVEQLYDVIVEAVKQETAG